MIKIKLKPHAEHILLNIIENLPKPELNGPWIAGGSVRNLIQNKPIESDVDLYFASVQQLVRFQYVLKHANFMQPTKYSYNYVLKNTKLQLMHFKFFSSIEELFDDFDFTVCQFAYHNGIVYTTEQALEHEKAKRLYFTPNSIDNRTFYRINKYREKGYHCPQITYEQAKKAEEERPNNRVKYKEESASFNELMAEFKPDYIYCSEETKIERLTRKIAELEQKLLEKSIHYATGQPMPYKDPYWDDK